MIYIVSFHKNSVSTVQLLRCYFCDYHIQQYYFVCILQLKSNHSNVYHKTWVLQLIHWYIHVVILTQLEHTVIHGVWFNIMTDAWYAQASSIHNGLSRAINQSTLTYLLNSLILIFYCQLCIKFVENGKDLILKHLLTAKCNSPLPDFKPICNEILKQSRYRNQQCTCICAIWPFISVIYNVFVMFMIIRAGLMTILLLTNDKKENVHCSTLTVKNFCFINILSWLTQGS